MREPWRENKFWYSWMAADIIMPVQFCCSKEQQMGSPPDFADADAAPESQRRNEIRKDSFMDRMMKNLRPAGRKVPGKLGRKCRTGADRGIEKIYCQAAGSRHETR